MMVFHAGSRGCWFDSDWNSCLVSPSLPWISSWRTVALSICLPWVTGWKIVSMSLSVFFLGLRTEDSCLVSLSRSVCGLRERPDSCLVSLSLLPWSQDRGQLLVSLSSLTLRTGGQLPCLSQSSSWVSGWRTVALSILVFFLGHRMEDSCLVSLSLLPGSQDVGQLPCLFQSSSCVSGWRTVALSLLVFFLGLRMEDSCLVSLSSLGLRMEHSCLVSLNLLPGSQDGGQLPCLS